MLLPLQRAVVDNAAAADIADDDDEDDDEDDDGDESKLQLTCLEEFLEIFLITAPSLFALEERRDLLDRDRHFRNIAPRYLYIFCKTKCLTRQTKI